MTTPAKNNLSFGQRMGVEPLPRQLESREISSELSALLWAITHDAIEGSKESGLGYDVIRDPWRSLLKSFFILRTHGDLDNFSVDRRWLLGFAKKQVFSSDYLKVFNFLDFIIGSKHCPRDYYESIRAALEHAHAAYRVAERMIVPVTSEENARAIAEALSTVGKLPAKGPSTHLQLAARNLTSGDWGGSIRESIHAIESAAKLIEPSADTLGPALSKLEARGAINGAQKRAFGALYGYTSDTQGVRHALTLDDKPAVTEQDAIFMFGACAAFTSYLVASQTSAGS